MKPVVFLSSTYRDSTSRLYAWHREREAYLGLLAEALGRVPFLPYVQIDALRDDDGEPESRVRSLENMFVLLDALLSPLGAQLWVLLRDDGTRSETMTSQVALAEGLGRVWWERTWLEFQEVVLEEAPYLLPDWLRLAVHPQTVLAWENPIEGLSLRRYADTLTAACVAADGWYVQDFVTEEVFAEGLETDQAGRDAADAALESMSRVT
jgi:hypothetical protein